MVLKLYPYVTYSMVNEITNTFVTVGTSSTAIITADEVDKWFILGNDGSTTIYLALSSDTEVTPTAVSGR